MAVGDMGCEFDSFQDIPELFHMGFWAAPSTGLPLPESGRLAPKSCPIKKGSLNWKITDSHSFCGDLNEMPPPIVSLSFWILGHQLVALFGQGWEVWPCYKKCHWGRGLMFQT